jgi:hypothetical protein
VTVGHDDRELTRCKKNTGEKKSEDIYKVVFGEVTVFEEKQTAPRKQNTEWEIGKNREGLYKNKKKKKGITAANSIYVVVFRVYVCGRILGKRERTKSEETNTEQHQQQKVRYEERGEER